MTDRRVLEYGQAPNPRRVRWVQVSRAVAIGLGMIWVICVVVFIVGLILSKPDGNW